MTTLQEYLKNQFPSKEDKENVKEINTNHNPFEKISGGELDLSEYPNLETVKVNGNYLKSPINKLLLGKQPELTVLSCSDNQLTGLDTTGCPNLKELVCSNNKLTGLDLSKNIKLERSSIRDNNFSEQDLSFLSHLVNLKYLSLKD